MTMQGDASPVKAILKVRGSELIQLVNEDDLLGDISQSTHRQSIVEESKHDLISSVEPRR